MLEGSLRTKRKLIKLVFKEFSLNGNNLTFTYTKLFKLLSKAVKETKDLKIEISPKFPLENSNQQKLTKKRGKIPYCSIWQKEQLLKIKLQTKKMDIVKELLFYFFSSTPNK
jgi:hypothetical protein